MKNNWEKLIFEDVFSIINDKTKQVKSSDYQKIGNYPIIDQSSDFICGFYDDEKKVVKKNLPIVIFGDHTRHVKFIEFPFVCGADGTQLIVPKINLQRKYLYYLILDASIKIGNYGYDRHLKHLKNFTGLVNSNTAQQRKIAEILSTCDEVIEKTEAAIAKYQALKQGMMHDLFTRGIDIKTGKLRPSYQDAPELYKESELGMIPNDWIVYTLDDLIEKYLDFRGKTPLKLGMNWGGGDIRALSANNVQMGAVNFDKECYYGSIDLYNKWMNKGDCEKGDVLMTMEAPLGNVAQVPDDKKYILSQRTILLKNKRVKIIKDFMYYLFCNNSFQSSLFINSTGSTVRGIQQKKLARLKVIIPKITKEQNLVSLRLKAIDNKINIEQSALAKYQQLKAGLMQDLLTGKIEVSVAEETLNN
jgi:type I restriction enzyme S subunit